MSRVQISDSVENFAHSLTLLSLTETSNGFGWRTDLLDTNTIQTGNAHGRQCANMAWARIRPYIYLYIYIYIYVRNYSDLMLLSVDVLNQVGCGAILNGSGYGRARIVKNATHGSNFR